MARKVKPRTGHDGISSGGMGPAILPAKLRNILVNKAMRNAALRFITECQAQQPARAEQQAALKQGLSKVADLLQWMRVYDSPYLDGVAAQMYLIRPDAPAVSDYMGSLELLASAMQAELKALDGQRARPGPSQEAGRALTESLVKASEAEASEKYIAYLLHEILGVTAKSIPGFTFNGDDPKNWARSHFKTLKK